MYLKRTCGGFQKLERQYEFSKFHSQIADMVDNILSMEAIGGNLIITWQLKVNR